MKIILAENFRTVFYTPFYVAYEKGEFKKRGIDIEFVESPAAGSAIEKMYRGQVDVVWGGPLRAIKLKDQGVKAEQELVCFCEVVGKDPFYLVMSNRRKEDFTLADLTDMQIGVVSEVPTPWICLQQDLRDAGIDPGKLHIHDQHTMDENLQRLEAGELDIIQVFEPYVSMAQTQGVGRVVHCAADRGDTAYTTFLTTHQSLEKNRAAYALMTDALVSIGPWINSADPLEIYRLVKQYYQHLPQDILTAAIKRYQGTDLWTCRHNISEPGFERLRQSMRNSGFITSLPSYDECTSTLEKSEK